MTACQCGSAFVYPLLPPLPVCTTPCNRLQYFVTLAASAQPPTDAGRLDFYWGQVIAANGDMILGVVLLEIRNLSCVLYLAIVNW